MLCHLTIWTTNPMKPGEDAFHSYSLFWPVLPLALLKRTEQFCSTRFTFILPSAIARTTLNAEWLQYQSQNRVSVVRRTIWCPVRSDLLPESEGIFCFNGLSTERSQIFLHSNMTDTRSSVTWSPRDPRLYRVWLQCYWHVKKVNYKFIN